GRDFRWVIKNGWIAPDTKKKGSYYITTTGLKVLAGEFSNELVKKSQYRTGDRRKKTRRTK
ncbi:unnamed protein product, partial [marine sediment metagenome]